MTGPSRFVANFVGNFVEPEIGFAFHNLARLLRSRHPPMNTAVQWQGRPVVWHGVLASMPGAAFGVVFIFLCVSFCQSEPLVRALAPKPSPPPDAAHAVNRAG